ncbi:MAG: response regulator transcription factor, partial [Chloroflexota bacterium]
MNTVPSKLKTTKVLITDDHEVLADALAMIIDREPQLQFVGAAGTIAACLSLAKQTSPDVILLDVNLPDGDGLTAVPDIMAVCPEAHILVLTSLADEKTLLRAIDTGVSGFVAKNRPLSEMLAAIRQAADGEITMPSSLLMGLVARVSRARPATGAQIGGGAAMLTKREREVLKHVARGQSAPDIAKVLEIKTL